jgi:hypothetical protein
MNMPMRSVQETGAEQLVWILAKDSVLTLLAGRETLAILRIGADWTENCESETADGRCILFHTGPFQNDMVVRKAGAATDTCTFTHELMGKGTVTFAYGKSFRFECSSMWKMDWRFQDSLDKTVMELKPAFSQMNGFDLRKGPGRDLCRIILARGAAQIPEVSILAVLGAHRLLYIGGGFMER